MSQLHTFLNTLDDAELAQIKDIRLIGKERTVFDQLVKYRGQELPANDDILQALGITGTHFYKIASVLLRKFYDKLADEGGIALLEYLKRKGLYTLLRHEALAQDKQWRKKQSSKEKENYYLQAFRLMLDLPYKYYDEKLRDAFGEKYLEAKADASESDSLYIKYHTLFADCNRLAAQKNPKEAFVIGPQQLEQFEKDLSGTEHYLALYYLYRTFCSYYTYYELNSAMQVSYLEKAMLLKDKIRQYFPVDVGQFLQLLYADALFRDARVGDAYKIYDETFSQGVAENMYGYHYHCEQYALSAIIKGEYDKALAILDKVFSTIIAGRTDIFATRGTLTYAKLYLSNGDHKKALQYISLGREINDKTFYQPFDVQLRLLENIHFFLIGDYDFAHLLATRNIKYIRSQKEAALLGDYSTIFKTMIAMINSIHRETALPAGYEEEYERISRQYINLYCNLLHKVRIKAKEETKIRS
jgi:hypothetical protein